MKQDIMKVTPKKTMERVRVNTTEIGGDSPVYIIAEAGFNHEGDLDIALKMIAKAAKAGANAIKFQSYQANELVLEDSPHYRLIKSGELSLDDHIKLSRAAKQHNITFLSTPFYFECADMLERIKVPAYKIASMDLTYLPLLKHVAQKGKPMLVSTGTGSLGEIERAISTINGAGNSNVILLHCLSEYPAPPEHINLRVIPMLKTVFQVPVGYSDHTIGTTIALASAVMGASVIEKHFTLDKSLPGPDHKLSADPVDLKKLVDDIRTVEASLGTSSFLFDRPDKEMRPQIRRSIFAKTNIPKGTRLTESLIRYVRPGAYLPPDTTDILLGKLVQQDIAEGEPITWDDICQID